MKTVWKWIIGILVVLVVAAVLVAGGLFLWAHSGHVFGVARVVRPGMQFPGNGKVPFRGYGNNAWGGRGIPMHGPAMMMGFNRPNILGMLFRGLLWVGLLTLIVLGIIWFIRLLRTPSAAVVAAPVAASPVEPVASVTSLHNCPRCGEPVQEGWKHCSNCGKKL